MEAINRFGELFLEVWKEGVFGLNASEIIIGIVIFLIFYVLRRLFASIYILVAASISYPFLIYYKKF